MSPAPEHAQTLALVGCGYWGRNLARNFLQLGALRVMCDAEDSILAGYGAEYARIQKTKEYSAVLRDPQIAQVAIATPAATHYALAKAALEAGKDVFVEKPLCLRVAEAEELATLAGRLERLVMVGHLLQYHPCVVRIKEVLGRGELGKLLYIASNRLNLGKIRREENALWSFAPHDISVILSLAGGVLPEKVRCVGGAYLSGDVADTTLTSLSFSNGLRSHVYVSWLHPYKEQRLAVVGSTGMVVFDDTRPWPEKLTIHREYLKWENGVLPTPNREGQECLEVAEAEPLREECRHFLDCCSRRALPLTDAREGARVLRVLHMAQRSLESDGEAQTGAGLRAWPPASADYYVHPTAVVDEGAEIGKGTKIWHFSHVIKGARIGEGCILGQNVNVDAGVRIGSNVKIQNNVSVYTGVEIEDDVFLGPSCVLTNVTNPRSQVNRHSLYERTVLRRGCTIGANATIVCGVTVGRYALVGAGTVVTRDVPDYALVMGNPARRHGWVSRMGQRLAKPDAKGVMICPESGHRYREVEPSVVRCLDLDEDAPLPSELRKGEKTYDEFKEATSGV